jgi:uncharacterized protein (DUF1778 family)
MSIAEKTERLYARLSQEQDRRLRDAAAALGVPVSQFAVEAADAAAQRVLAEQHLLRIPLEHAEAFYASLDAPPVVIPEMERLAQVEPFDQA